ncbi:hypothetical protein LWC35_07080 [Pseudonocardia kujensis]|nr:hypothetical protein [Pseudonocardia kujensis]
MGATVLVGAVTTANDRGVRDALVATLSVPVTTSEKPEPAAPGVMHEQQHVLVLPRCRAAEGIERGRRREARGAACRDGARERDLGAVKQRAVVHGGAGEGQRDRLARVVLDQDFVDAE